MRVSIDYPGFWFEHPVPLALGQALEQPNPVDAGRTATRAAAGWREEMAPTASNSAELPEKSAGLRGAKKGAKAAMLVALVVLILPTAIRIASFGTVGDVKQVAGWLPLIFVSLLMWTAIAAFCGAVAGALGTKARHPIWAGILGTVLPVLIAVVCIVLFVSPREPRETPLSWLLYMAVGGYIAGASGCMAGRSARGQNDSRVQSWLFLSPAVVALVAWETNQFLFAQAEDAIVRLGGSVCWNSIEDPQGFWVVSLRGPQIVQVGPGERQERAAKLRVAGADHAHRLEEDGAPANNPSTESRTICLTAARMPDE
jgi:hypothetical protein